MADKRLIDNSSSTTVDNFYGNKSGADVQIPLATAASVLAGSMGISNFGAKVYTIVDKTYVLYLPATKIGTQIVGMHIVKNTDGSIETRPFSAEYNSEKQAYNVLFSPPLPDASILVSFFLEI